MYVRVTKRVKKMRLLFNLIVVVVVVIVQQ